MDKAELAKINKNLQKELTKMAGDKQDQEQLEFIEDVLVESANSIPGYRQERGGGNK